jgi:hypothetical protein
MLGFYLNDVIMTPVCRPETVVFSPLMLLPDHALDDLLHSSDRTSWGSNKVSEKPAMS